jgi:hypothetical protein
MAMSRREWLAAVAAGGAAAGATAADPPAPGKPADPDPVRAADPLGAMLADAKAAYAKLRDYTCTYTRQERTGGALGAEQVAELKVRVKPYSVAVRFARPEAVAGQEGIYLAARPGKVRVREKAGGPYQLLSIDDPKALAVTRLPLPEVGVGPAIDRVAAVVGREKAAGNPLEVFTAGYTFAGRPVTRYEVFARRPHAHRYAYRVLVFVDHETGLPVRVEAHDAPKPGQTAGDLLEAYSYTDLKPNVGLGDAAFGE